MATNTLDKIIENLFYVLPIIHKKLLKIEPQDVGPNFNLSRIQIGILAILNDENGLPISEIAKKLLIPKPQMTRLINNLVKSGMAQRQPDLQDRRVVKIVLTPKGRTTLAQCEEILKNNIKKRLSYLTEKELEELSLVLAKLRDLGSRLEERKTQCLKKY
jgi:DNA-binding MarR family transcriptional regulator